MKFSRKIGSGPTNKRLNFGGDPDHRLNTGTVFRIRQSLLGNTKSVNGHKFSAYIDSPDGGTGKRCLGGGMHCLSASSFRLSKMLVKFECSRPKWAPNAGETR